jgi:MFS family permease
MRTDLPPPLVGVLCLPGGMSQGFVSVALGYVLAQDGIGVDVIAGLVGLELLPWTWSFLAGPLIDVSFTAVRWYVGSTIGLSLCAVGFALAPLQASGTAVLAVLCLASGITAVSSSSAVNAVMAVTTVKTVRGACAGWRQTGYLGGMGLGGGAGLWLTTHAGGLRIAALALAAASLVCIWPFLIVRVPAAARGAGLVPAARESLATLWNLVRTRTGVLAAVAVTLPAGLGAAAYLLPSVAGDWHASADFVAAVTGALSGFASIPGCITSGYLCDRFHRRKVYMACALIAAIGEGLLAFAPHTPEWFAALVLVGAALTGLAYGSVTAVYFELLESVGAATVGGVLGSLCSLPVVIVTMLIGAVQVRHGSKAMLLVEAGLGVFSVAAYAILVRTLRPEQTIAVQPRAEGFA